MASKSNESESSEIKKSATSESGLANNYAIEVVGLLGLATLIYATFALFFIA